MSLSLSAQLAKPAFIAIAIAAAVLLAGSCSSTADRIASAPTRPRSREIVVSGAKWVQGVTISVHDILAIPPPGRYDEWRVHTAGRDVLRLLTKGDRVRRPGVSGWRIEAIGRGTATVTFIPFVSSGESSSAPNEPKFILRVTVQ